LLLDADQKFRAAGFLPHEAIFQAGRRRLRPIVMTAPAQAVASTAAGNLNRKLILL
jgi:multidrug efflux pump subunit AcrB